MIRGLLGRLCRIRVEGPWTMPARGGGPALDRALDDDEITVEASERGLTGRDRTDWIERQHERILTQDRPGHARRIGLYFPDGQVPM